MSIQGLPELTWAERLLFALTICRWFSPFFRCKKIKASPGLQAVPQWIQSPNLDNPAELPMQSHPVQLGRLQQSMPKKMHEMATFPWQVCARCRVPRFTRCILGTMPNARLFEAFPPFSSQTISFFRKMMKETWWLFGSVWKALTTAFG